MVCHISYSVIMITYICHQEQLKLVNLVADKNNSAYLLGHMLYMCTMQKCIKGMYNCMAASFPLHISVNYGFKGLH